MLSKIIGFQYKLVNKNNDVIYLGSVERCRNGT